MASRIVDRNDPDVIIQQIKAASAFDGFTLDPKTESIIRRHLNGNITEDEMMQEVRKLCGLDSY